MPLSLAFIVVGLISFFFLCRYFERQSSDSPRLLFHGSLFLFNNSLYSLILRTPFLIWLMYQEKNGGGFLGSLPVVPKIIGAIILFDLIGYGTHRLFHGVPFFWRFHQVHHSDQEVDVTSALRVHFGQLVFAILIEAIAIGVLNPGLAGYGAYWVCLHLAIYFHHANLPLSESTQSRLGAWIVTPRYHRSHHAKRSDQRHGNFANIFPIWDKWFGSRHSLIKETSFGTETSVVPLSFEAVLLSPLRRQA